MKFKKILSACITVMMLLGCALTVSAADASQYKGKIVCENNRTAAVTKDGSLYMWGYNENGQIGDGTTRTKYSPVKILSNVVSVALKESYSAAITKDGSLYMWGTNYYGRLGTGKNGWDDEYRPVKVLSNVVSVELGEYFCGAVTSGGDLYMWGKSDQGQVGNGTVNAQYSPVKVMSNVSKFYVEDQYDASYCAAITRGGDLYMWGSNENGQIGNGTTNDQLKPLKVLSGVQSAAIYADYDGAYTAAVKKDGNLYMWGYNYYGQIGNGSSTLMDEHKPVKVLSDVKSVHLYDKYSMAIQKDGSLYSWGGNDYGRLGNGKKVDVAVSPVKILSGVAKVEMANDHCAAILKNGDFYTWGHYYSAGAGIYDYSNIYVPVKVMQNAVDVKLYDGSGMVLTKNGTLYSWGDNYHGKLGINNDNNHVYAPRKVLGEVAYVELSETYHNAAVSEDGSLYLWGDNEFGQIGNNTRVTQPVPVKVMDKAFAAQSSTASGVERIAGSNRYQTSYKIASSLKSKQGVQKFDTVIIADGRNFPDALAGSYLAKVKSAPILMANEKNAESLQTYVKTNLKSGGMIYVLGGESAVPQSILDGFSGYSVKRLQGNNRYATNLMILEEAGVTDEDILVCTGNGFADSLSASATGKPILLVKNKNFTEEQIQFLEAHRGNDYYIIGGEGAVSAEQMTEINNCVYGYVERIAGDSRYETSVKVAEEFFEKPETVVLAYGKNFPDGLCGGPLAMSFDAPLILAATKTIAPAEDYVDANYIATGKVLGGDSLISNAAVNKIF